ncbi:sporulation integral membrane protein YtvI [Clostridium thermosuccinogenes]|jgi:sporulation integral membrane protein YtvI|uniref:sporulation integral membrane protein YtvI n=1 Tax=Clostridium thermosuccinogenes TaxID=84032 RepID=UPI001FA93F87|nr:sporulation integral membrane protein YtvI [Pseudoclostridium thermosuccinogenes]
MGIDLNAKNVLKLLLAIAGIFLGVFVFFKLAFYLIPFIIAFALSNMMEPLVKLLVNKVRLPRKAASAITILLVLLVLGLIITKAVSSLIREITSMSATLPQLFTELYNNIDAIVRKGMDIYLGLPKEVTLNIEKMLSNLSSTLMNLINSLFTGILNTAISLPEALIFTIVTILSTYFMTSDRERIYSFIKKQVPESWVHKVITIKDDMFSALFGYIRAQLILMAITFTELYTGFLIIRISHPLTLALVISIIDALPILGTGGVLIPWAIYELLTGDFRLAVSLVILYLIVLVVRQMIEPKVLGHQIGVHPLLTLVAMYTGLRLMGFAGMIVGPITLLLLRNIISGILKNRTLKELLSPDEKPT